MGDQTCIVLLGFVFVHMAVILSVVSMGSPDWIRAEQNMTLLPSANVTNNRTSKGFWQLCQDKTCESLNQTIQTDSFRASQVLFTMGMAECIFDALLMYVFIGLTAFQNSFRAGVLATVSSLSATLWMLTSVIIYGVKAKDENPDIDDDLIINFSWSYYCGIAAIVFSFLSTFSIGRRTQKVHGRPISYQDI